MWAVRGTIHVVNRKQKIVQLLSNGFLSLRRCVAFYGVGAVKRELKFDFFRLGRGIFGVGTLAALRRFFLMVDFRLRPKLSGLTGTTKLAGLAGLFSFLSVKALNSNLVNFPSFIARVAFQVWPIPAPHKL